MSNLITFMQAHWGAIAAFLIAAIDFGMALNPAWKSNGILHFVYVSLGGKETAPVLAPPAG